MRTIFTLFLSFVLTSILYAQFQTNTNLPSFKFQGRPMPDWVVQPKNIPAPHNSTYYYKVFFADDSIKDEAKRKVIREAYLHAISERGSNIKVQLNEFDAMVKGENINLLENTYDISLHNTCEFFKKTPDGTKTVYWILFQIGSPWIKDPTFNTHFEDCEKCEKWERDKKNYKKMIENKKYESDVRSIIASSFVPGMGQILKGYWGVGTIAFIASDLILFGTGTACYFSGKEQAKIMRSLGTNYDQYQRAKKKKTILDVTMYASYGIGTAVHIGNMLHAWKIDDKHIENINLAFIPTNDYGQLAYAVGASIRINL